MAVGEPRQGPGLMGAGLEGWGRGQAPPWNLPSSAVGDKRQRSAGPPVQTCSSATCREDLGCVCWGGGVCAAGAGVHALLQPRGEVTLATSFRKRTALTVARRPERGPAEARTRRVLSRGHVGAALRTGVNTVPLAWGGGL